MSSIQVSATERFDEVALSSEIVDGRVGSLHTIYTCPLCREKVSFSRDDFESRGRRETSNLSTEHSAAISDLAQASDVGDNEYLDWYCPKCRLPVRAYFRQWAGGRHGDSGIDIITVIELQESRTNVL
jgi:rubredoxin